MRLDELRQALATRIEGAPVPGDHLDAVVRQGRRRRAVRRLGTTATILAILLVMVVAVLVVPRSREHPTGTVTTSRVPPPIVTDSSWALHPTEVAGLERGTSFSALATSARTFLLAGARPVGVAGRSRAAIWHSADGDRWTRAEVPARSGRVLAIAANRDYALAVGTEDDSVSGFVWRSDDDGRRWRAVAAGRELFGDPAPAMGRPFVAGLRFAHGRWVASGGASDGYAGLWTSRDGIEWDQVLDAARGRPAGSIDLVDGGRGRLFGFWSTVGWYSTDATTWSSPTELSVPEPLFLRTVAPGATVAFGGDVNRQAVPTPLLRSRDDGETWFVAPAFLAQLPGASVRTVTRHDGLWIAAGSTGTDDPDAWVSTDLSEWHAMPTALRRAPGAALSLVGAVRGRVVLFGADSELDRYYTFDTRRVPDAGTADDSDLSPVPDRFVCTFGIDPAHMNADGLPYVEDAATDRDRADAVLDAHRQQILDAHPFATSVTVGIGFERAWAGQIGIGGATRIVPVHDYAILVRVASSSDCPSGATMPIAVDNVPVFFTVGP